MKIIDVILALIGGAILAFLAMDFSVSMQWPVTLLFWMVLLPIISLSCLLFADLIGKKIAVIFQIAKHLLVGAVTTVIDLKLFEFLLAIFLAGPLLSKSVSFLLSTALKYAGNKYWAFQTPGRQNIKREVAYFFFITLIGLLIDVTVFYYATHLLGPQFGISIGIWVKLSVIFAAITAAAWNFLGYKFLVFSASARGRDESSGSKGGPASGWKK